MIRVSRSVFSSNPFPKFPCKNGMVGGKLNEVFYDINLGK